MFLSIRNTSHGQNNPACRLLTYCPSGLYYDIFFFVGDKILITRSFLCSLRGKTGGKKQAELLLCQKKKANALDNSQNKQRNSSDNYRITNYKYFLTVAHHIHGFLRPAWAHLFAHIIYKHCTKLFLEHSVKGQFHKGRMISNIYIWLLSHCNIYKEQKAL